MCKSSKYLRRRLAWLLGDSPVLSTGADVGVDVTDGVSVDVGAWANAVAAPTIASEMDFLVEHVLSVHQLLEE